MDDITARIVIADDHLMFRKGLRSLLEREGFAVLDEASTGREAIQAAAQHQCELAILDFSMPMLNGLDAAKEILKRSPGTQVILLTMHAEEEFVLEALRAGVRGYVLKDQAFADLSTALHEILKGSLYLSPGLSAAVLAAYQSPKVQSPEVLTDRERQILQLVAEGHSTKETASILSLSVKTVESHRTRIMQKLDVHEIAGLVRYAFRRGIIKL